SSQMDSCCFMQRLLDPQMFSTLEVEGGLGVQDYSQTHSDRYAEKCDFQMVSLFTTHPLPLRFICSIFYHAF
ncbi:hypothetical protein STEG23_026039, partial [Scotinomys teguina]